MWEGPTGQDRGHGGEGQKHVLPLLESHLQLTSLTFNLPLVLIDAAKGQVIGHWRIRAMGVTYQTITTPGV